MAQKSLENLLNSNADGELGDIVRRAREMGALTDALLAALPPGLGNGILAARVRSSGELIVLASSPAWAAKLRFETDSLLAAAQSAGAAATTCNVRVSRDCAQVGDGTL